HFFFSSRRRHTRFSRDWSSDVCSSDLPEKWKNEYKKTMALIAAEEARMQNLAEVFRSFELSGFGIYNWDKILEGEQSAELAGERSEERRVGKEGRAGESQHGGKNRDKR